ncbi:unnamed protein product [Phyllotreta striolata]|uniref:FAS1 domain-containing protein n=1 Tax=Phyllotreta striolata TaxID=444603 RepID=A0A9N9XQD3_PHYSR|nr:unnamed protein product [Phyllotreta striolata]
MLLKAFLVLSTVCLIGVKTDFYNDLSLFHELQQEPLKLNWNWDGPVQSRRAVDRPDDVEEASDERKEPLSKNYKDPVPASSEQKPVLRPTPKPKPSEGAGKPEDALLHGGVVSVDAGGFGGPLVDLPEFDFASSFGLGSRPFGIGDLLNSFQVNQWWKGENVCVEREESTDNENEEGENNEEKKNSSTQAPKTLPDLFSTSISLSNCFETPSKYECLTKINNHGVIKTFTVRYKCCYGYGRTKGGCEKLADLKPLLQTLDDIKIKEFRDLIKTAGLDEKFNSGNYSLFAPSDNGLADYNEKLNEMNNVVEVVRRRRASPSIPAKELVLSHAVQGFLDLTEIDNDEVIYSENDNSSIRINIYPTSTRERLYTVNCARVKTPNVLAENGIIHVTDGIVVPVSQNVETVIKEHPKLRMFSKAISNTDIPSRMKSNGHYTVFAPTDEAFAKLDESQRQKILSGSGCSASILKFHFTPHTICSPAIVGNATTHNVEGDTVHMQRTNEDELIFEKTAKIVEADVVATNGVIHLIDTIIIPDSGLYIGNVLNHRNYSKFQELIQKAELDEQINSLQNATIFVPSNAVFESTEGKKLLGEMENDPEKLKDMIRYHTVKGLMPSNDMNNNAKLETYNEGKELRLNLYSTLPLFTNVVNRATVNCARLVGFDEKACGSVLHEVNKFLVPPTENILEVIANDAKYSTLRTLLKDTEAERILQQNNRSLTFLAPTDETFAALDEKDKEALLNDKKKAEYVLKNHILTEVLCCSGVGPQSWGFSSFVSTLSNTQVEIGRTGSRVRINGAIVTSCDNMATNGVVHTINKVLLPRQPQVPSLGGFFLFDI